MGDSILETVSKEVYNMVEEFFKNPKEYIENKEYYILAYDRISLNRSRSSGLYATMTCERWWVFTHVFIVEFEKLNNPDWSTLTHKEKVEVLDNFYNVLVQNLYGDELVKDYYLAAIRKETRVLRETLQDVNHPSNYNFGDW